MDITMGDEQVIVRGIRSGEQPWGACPYPRSFHLGNRLIIVRS